MLILGVWIVLYIFLALLGKEMTIAKAAVGINKCQG